MIPARLRLRNFMCYRGDGLELDFGAVHLACLAGRNGHGKSALLDAMTWSLWGKARAARDNDLISLGEEEMEVQFDFYLGDNLYRVIRKRSAAGRGRSSLELQVAHEDRFNALSESAIRATQLKIDELLRMDYDTFINSAFLLQGRANEFTTKSPAERKRILGEILGLSIYDQYEQRARDLAREAAAEERSTQSRLDEIERELNHEEQYRREEQAAQEKVTERGEALRQISTELERLRQQKRELDLQRKRRDEWQLRLRRAEREWAEAERALVIQQKRIAGLEETLSRKAEIEAGHQSLIHARKVDQMMNETLSALMPLREERSRLQREIDGVKMALQGRQQALEKQMEAARQRVAERQAHSTELVRVQEELAALEAQATRLEELRQIQGALSAEQAGLKAQNERLRQDMDDIKEKIDLLQQAEASCPLCGSELDDDHQQEMLHAFRQQGTERGDQFRDNKARLAEIAQALKDGQAEVQRINRQLRAQKGLQAQQARLEQTLQDADAAAQQVAEAAPVYDQISRQMATGDFAAALRAELADVGRRIESLGYDAAAHRQARADAQQYAPFERQAHELETAAQLLSEAQERRESLEAAMTRWQQEVAQAQSEVAELEEALTSAGDLDRALDDAQAQHDDLRAQEAAAIRELGAARQKLENCHVLTSERTRLQDKVRETAQRKGAYEELRLAFGQKGLRAMIIESVIPEIEDEANRLLARMTENRMHVRFETQRETLRGDTVETLEIQIADELGTRKYEMYSGGEAFRVDFAIRIALSKLLARRAGAQLQTLVVDEGFGTQDAQGRERLIEAINSISDDFACILVITHIEELQDAFPVRIIVTKTPDGSRFAVA